MSDWNVGYLRLQKAKKSWTIPRVPKYNYYLYINIMSKRSLYISSEWYISVLLESVRNDRIALMVWFKTLSEGKINNIKC